jgi:hypothetical protein
LAGWRVPPDRRVKRLARDDVACIVQLIDAVEPRRREQSDTLVMVSDLDRLARANTPDRCSQILPKLAYADLPLPHPFLGE